ncbi:MAG: hypothetical protein Q4B22_07920 [Eubacteriales bacterium]|nr:hypothetical protein [Eubacteriales bacterium]
MTKKQEAMFVVIQDLCLAFIINSAATILNGGFTDTWVYLVGMFEAFSINYVAGLMIPVPEIGRKAADLTGLKDGSKVHYFIRVFVTNAIYVTIISFTIALINVGPKPEIFGIWISTYPILHLVGLVASLLLEGNCVALAKTIVND